MLRFLPLVAFTVLLAACSGGGGGSSSSTVTAPATTPARDPTTPAPYIPPPDSRQPPTQGESNLPTYEESVTYLNEQKARYADAENHSDRVKRNIVNNIRLSDTQNEPVLWTRPWTRTDGSGWNDQGDTPATDPMSASYEGRPSLSPTPVGAEDYDTAEFNAEQVTFPDNSFAPMSYWRYNGHGLQTATGVTGHTIDGPTVLVKDYVVTQRNALGQVVRRSHSYQLLGARTLGQAPLNDPSIKKYSPHAAVTLRSNHGAYNQKIAYRRGLTGKGVVIAVVDRGFFPDHFEMQGQYLTDLAFNVDTRQKGRAAFLQEEPLTILTAAALQRQIRQAQLPLRHLVEAQAPHGAPLGQTVAPTVVQTVNTASITYGNESYSYEKYYKGNFHGLSVSSVIAGNKNGRGLVGLAFDAKIIPIIFPKEKSFSKIIEDVMGAAYYAVRQGARIISSSTYLPHLRVGSPVVENVRFTPRDGISQNRKLQLERRAYPDRVVDGIGSYQRELGSKASVPNAIHDLIHGQVAPASTYQRYLQMMRLVKAYDVAYVQSLPNGDFHGDLFLLAHLYPQYATHMVFVTTPSYGKDAFSQRPACAGVANCLTGIGQEHLVAGYLPAEVRQDAKLLRQAKNGQYNFLRRYVLDARGKTEGIIWANGNSFATPSVAAGLALVAQAYSDMSMEEVIQVLLRTAYKGRIAIRSRHLPGGGGANDPNPNFVRYTVDFGDAARHGSGLMDLGAATSFSYAQARLCVQARGAAVTVACAAERTVTSGLLRQDLVSQGSGIASFSFSESNFGYQPRVAQAMARGLAGKNVMLLDALGRYGTVPLSTMVFLSDSREDIDATLQRFTTDFFSHKTLLKHGHVRFDVATHTPHTQSRAGQESSQGNASLRGQESSQGSAALQGVSLTQSFDKLSLWGGYNRDARETLSLLPDGYQQALGLSGAFGLPAMNRDSEQKSYGLSARLSTTHMPPLAGLGVESLTMMVFHKDAVEHKNLAESSSVALAIDSNLTNTWHGRFLLAHEISKDGNLLGRGRGAFAAQSPRTPSTFLATQMAYDLTPRWRLLASYMLGFTQLPATQGPLHFGSGRLITESASLGLLGGGLWHPRDKFSVALHAPMRLRHGNAHLTLPVRRDRHRRVHYAQVNFTLVSPKRPVDFEVSYSARLSAATRVKFGALVRRHAFHSPHQSTQTMVMGVVSHKF